METKNIRFVEANVVRTYAKFQPHLPCGFLGDDCLVFFTNLAFRLPWQPIKFSRLDKIHICGRGLPKKHF